MKLVLAEKPSVAMSLSKVIGANQRGDRRAMITLAAGVWGSCWNFPSRKSMIKSMPSGGMMIFRFHYIGVTRNVYTLLFQKQEWQSKRDYCEI